MQEFTKFRQNLNKVKKDRGWSNKQLAEFAGVTDQVISNWLTGRTPNPPIPDIRALCDNSGIRITWLMDGDGSPIYDVLRVNEPEPTYLPRSGRAGHAITQHYRVHVRGLLSPIVESLPEAVYEVFQVEGSSMEKTLTQGDFLLCRMDSIEHMIDNRVYVLVLQDPLLKVYRESGIWIKRCSNRKENGYISCRSDNKDTTEPYPTFRVIADHVKEIWYPVLKITHHLSDPNRDIYDRLDELESRIELLEIGNE